MDNNTPLVPHAVASFAAQATEATGVEPTVTRQPRRRWLVELRSDRVYATHWFRDDWLTGKTVYTTEAVLEVDGQRRDTVCLEALAELLRYPDGKPGKLPPLTEVVDPERAPRRVRQTYETLRDQLAEHPQIRVSVGVNPAQGFDIALDLSEDCGLRISFRKTDRGWTLCDQELVVVVEGIDRSREVRAGGLAAAMKALMNVNPQPEVPEGIGTPSAAKTTPTSVLVRKNTVRRV